MTPPQCPGAGPRSSRLEHGALQLRRPSEAMSYLRTGFSAAQTVSPFLCFFTVGIVR
jgi:hypothetical protein